MVCSKRATLILRSASPLISFRTLSTRSMRVATSFSRSSIFSPSVLRAISPLRGALALHQFLQLFVRTGLQQIAPKSIEADMHMIGGLQFVGRETGLGGSGEIR